MLKRLSSRASSWALKQETVEGTAADLATSKQMHAETLLKVEVLEQEVVGLKEKLEEKTRLAAGYS